MVAVNTYGKCLSTILGAFALLLSLSNPALACTINASWTQSGGSAALPRYQGECAYQAAALGNTLTHSMADVGTYTVAFYALTRFNAGSTASNTVTIFRASDNSSPKFEIRVKGNGTADLAVIGGTTLTGNINTPTANYNDWNHYKAVWNGSNISFFINGNQVAGSPSMAGVLDTQQIGHIASSTPNLAGNLAFDHFVSLLLDDVAQTGVLCAGDSNDSGGINVTDAIQAFNDGALDLLGQPDFNGNGGVNVTDAIQIFNNQGACP